MLLIILYSNTRRLAGLRRPAREGPGPAAEAGGRLQGPDDALSSCALRCDFRDYMTYFGQLYISCDAVVVIDLSHQAMVFE